MVDNNNESKVPETQEASDAGERLFTQEEVTRIVQQRLAKVKEANKATEEEISAKVAEAVKGRTAELDAKEQQLNCRLYLIDKGYPAELLDALDTSDSDSFKQKADSLVHAMSRSTYRAPLGDPEPINIGVSAIDKAFSANNKHEPKQWPPAYD